MRVLSYNLRKNRAVPELTTLVLNHSPDLICLQEADPQSLPDQIGPLQLVHSTENNRLGLAIYANDERFEPLSAKTFKLKSSMHDRLLSPAHERLLGVHLYDHEEKQGLVAASFHAAPLTALNSLRRHQIEASHSLLKDLGGGLPSLMVGDFNYPIFHNLLDSKVRSHGFDMTVSDKRTYTRYKLFRGHFDFATSYGLNVSKITTLDRGGSDHLPILVEAGYMARSLVSVPVAA
ncbi:MAG TPA: endonuclease/exonuclease/phosphatase family protein [Microbacteriaceae bacterium]|nr:endonuclease/exonuclease/phosphatase family protein [Microbacteriaceae bacterium]